MRIIDADDIVYESIDSSDTTRYEYYYGTGILAVRKEDIDEMPTIELPERKKGKWVFEEYPDGYYYSECSECKHHFIEDVYLKSYNFCPNCGCDMRGDE